MPRFFFNRYADGDFLDAIGRELPDLTSARRAALCDAREAAAEQVLKGHLNLTHWIHVIDADGVLLETITFKDAVAVIS